MCCSFLFLLTLAPQLGAQGAPQQPPTVVEPAQPPPPPSPSQPPPPGSVQIPPPQAAPQPPSVQTQTAPPPQTPAPRPQPQSPTVDLRDTGGDAYSIEPVFWFTRSAPNLQLGRQAKMTTTDSTTGAITPGQAIPGNLQFPGTSPYGLGAILTFPTTHENSIEISGFRIDGKGSTTETQDLILFGNNFSEGDLLTTSFRVQNLKLSWNYLSYPYPSKSAKFRLKTLWEVQYVGISTVVNAPYDTNSIPTVGNKDVIFPTLGLGIEYHPSKSIRLEAKGSGFALLHRADIWDIQGSIVVKMGPIEGFVGGKGYHFKTSPQDDQYFTQTLWGPYVGVRYIFR